MKIKLNIQRFGATNHTAHYDLSQYTANDTTSYLIDYNGDMNKIDTAIYDADSRSLVNESAIGTMSNLETTDKSSLVGAINEVNTQVETNTSNITTLNTNVSANTGNIGTMANLQTTDKTSLVNAVNEVDTQVGTNTTDISTINESLTDIINELNELEPFILWTNPNPTSNFSAQNITLNSADYDLYEVVFSPGSGQAATATQDSTGMIFKGKSTRCIYIDLQNNDIKSRRITYVDDTTLAIATGYASGLTNPSITDGIGHCIPEFIIGYKSKLI